MNPKAITEALKTKAHELGFSHVGVVPAVPGRTLGAYLRWIEAGMHGKMAYLARSDRLVRRQDLTLILSHVKSIICVGMDYFTQAPPPHLAADPSRGRISNYAWGVDYHDVMTPRLKLLGEWLQTVCGDHPIANRVYVDTGAILERDHAQSAGLGFIGKNTMLIGPRHGSWFFLGELLTTLPLDYDRLSVPLPSCGSCNHCQTACPTAAFPQPYVLDARRCISYLTIELKGWIPQEFRPLLGNWIYGCDICQDVCPFNRFAPAAAKPTFSTSNWDYALPPLLDILALDENGFHTRFANSPIKRIKRRRLIRNACVAAGNWGSTTAVPILTALLDDSEAIIRGHAAWALKQIGGAAAETAVNNAIKNETDEQVRLEMS